MTIHKDNKYDFMAMGQAIKEARLKQGWTREQLAQEVDLAPRYIMSLENKGQHPSFQVFVELMTLFNISVDQFLFPDTKKEKSSVAASSTLRWMNWTNGTISCWKPRQTA